MVIVKRYDRSYKKLWDEFNCESKNSIFMFDRNYMDYHSDRFVDHSLLFFDEDKLVALLPISELDGMFVSHGGLTYGGFITDGKMRQHLMNECFEKLFEYMRGVNINRLKYKAIPHVFYKQPAEEDLFSIYYFGGSIEKIEASTVINLQNPYKMPKGRKAQISKAKREHVIVSERDDFESYKSFIDLENQILSERHGTKAVHSAEELKMLHDSFPQNIRLICAAYQNSLIAGAVVYEYAEAIHIQYMAADDIARKIGALDLVINEIIERYKGQKSWLDFGISTENDGKYLNEGLISQKEGFGGRTNVYTTWMLRVEEVYS